MMAITLLQITLLADCKDVVILENQLFLGRIS